MTAPAGRRDRLALAGLLAAGLLAWLGERSLSEAGWIHRTPLVITAGLQQQMLAEWRAEAGHALSPAERATLLRQAVEDEVLYREALRRRLDIGNPAVEHRLALLMQVIDGNPGEQPPPARIPALADEARRIGLDRGDLAIRRHLVLQMRLLAGTDTSAAPDDATLEAFMRAHSQAFIVPGQRDFTQVFFSFRRHGADAEALARQGFVKATAGVIPAGDPWPTGLTMTGTDHALVSGLFGSAVADAVFQAPATGWLPPVASPFGWHLLRVSRIAEPRLPPLDSVRDRALARYRQHQSRLKLADALPRLANATRSASSRCR